MNRFPWFQFGKGLAICVVLVVALAWFIRHTIRRSGDPQAIRRKWCITLGLLLGLLVPVGLTGPSVGAAFIVPIACVAIAVVLSLLWTPHLGAWFALPITSLIDGGQQEVDPVAVYSIAQARRKAGRYQEAIAEVRRQLEAFPGDFHGEMLLAAIYAENLDDLPRARMILQGIFNRNGVSDGQLAGAMNTLADWELKYSQDTTLAAAALQAVVARLPGTDHASVAEQRLAHLGQAGQRVAEAQDRARITLRAGVERIGLRKEAVDVRPAEASPAERAGALVEQLRQHPNDNEAREALAQIYAEDYGRHEMAIAELDALVEREHQPSGQVARWLHRIADIQMRQMHDMAAAAATLQRIAAKYPKSALADQAQARIALLARERQGQQKTAALTLGEYEQRLGLKKSKPQV